MRFIDENKQEVENYEQKKSELFEKGINEMKQSTRRYAKTQIKWVKNKFIKSRIFQYLK